MSVAQRSAYNDTYQPRKNKQTVYIDRVYTYDIQNATESNLQCSAYFNLRLTLYVKPVKYDDGAQKVDEQYAKGQLRS